MAELDAQPSGQIAIIDEALCTLCGVCVSVCPTGAITMEDAVRVDPPKCTGCAICVRECPSEAIHLGPVAS
ncbi:MAG: 4Fe-4S binding protein [Phycisphaerales bacterium]|nr:4Fe-4S binding protein [Phycisphaerales bacterium]